MSTNDRDILEDSRWLAQQLDRVAEGVRNLQALPFWAQATHSMLTYNPESVLYQATRWRPQLDDCTDKIGRVCVILAAAHRIHRFGAGPALKEAYMDALKEKIATLAHPEDLAEGVACAALEPHYYPHAGHQRMDWPIVLLPDYFYATERCSPCSLAGFTDTAG